MNILILTYWSYPDALIQTYTLPYVRIIKKKLPSSSKIFLVTLEKNTATLKGEAFLRIEEQLLQENIYWLPLPYKPFSISALRFWALTSVKLSIKIIRNHISVIHCWCTPAGAIGFFLATLLRKPLIIDSYEPHAEAMVENGTWAKNSLAFKLLFWLEKKQTQKALHIISATEKMKDYALLKYGVAIRNFYVKPACVDLSLFSEQNKKDEDLLRKLSLEDKLVCVYAGKFGGIYLDQEVFDFFKVARTFWGDLFRVLLLTSHTREEIDHYCDKANLDKAIVVSTFVDHKLIPKYLGLGDFAITPVKPVPTKRFCTPIKDGEYWSLGLPVVITANISDDSEIIERHNIGVVLKRLDNEGYLEAVKKIEEILRQPRKQTFKTIRSVAERYRNYQLAERTYGLIYTQ
ncbi:MAG TPA: hypothetical protein DGG95_13210 [Cytophagales bacterium]|jgi:glycosyltransferase involved in cell wall biosynthesis|nr:hypothetical protein [Cytophagales bacterium]